MAITTINTGAGSEREDRLRGWSELSVMSQKSRHCIFGVVLSCVCYRTSVAGSHVTADFSREGRFIKRV